jgi:hypothetical protein
MMTNARSSTGKVQATWTLALPWPTLCSHSSQRKFLAIVWAVSILPTRLRQIGFAVVVLWVLATLGIIAVAGLSSILMIAIIIGVLASLLGLVEGRVYRRVTCSPPGLAAASYGGGPGGRRSRAAMVTRSARESASIFRITLPR